MQLNLDDSQVATLKAALSFAMNHWSVNKRAQQEAAFLFARLEYAEENPAEELHDFTA